MRLSILGTAMYGRSSAIKKNPENAGLKLSLFSQHVTHATKVAPRLNTFTRGNLTGSVIADRTIIHLPSAEQKPATSPPVLTSSAGTQWKMSALGVSMKRSIPGGRGFTRYEVDRATVLYGKRMAENVKLLHLGLSLKLLPPLHKLNVENLTEENIGLGSISLTMETAQYMRQPIMMHREDQSAELKNKGGTGQAYSDSIMMNYELAMLEEYLDEAVEYYCNGHYSDDSCDFLPPPSDDSYFSDDAKSSENDSALHTSRRSSSRSLDRHREDRIPSDSAGSREGEWSSSTSRRFPDPLNRKNVHHAVLSRHVSMHGYDPSPLYCQRRGMSQTNAPLASRVVVKNLIQALNYQD